MLKIKYITRSPLNCYKTIQNSESNRLPFYIVAIVIVSTLLFYVFSREMHSLNKAIKAIDEFAGKE